eukprot:15476999-Alexandrium_andersonii.AAC.1
MLLWPEMPKMPNIFRRPVAQNAATAEDAADAESYSETWAQNPEGSCHSRCPTSEQSLASSAHSALTA